MQKKKGKGKGKGQGERIRGGGGKGEGKGGRKKKCWTHGRTYGNSGDFVLCPMLCIAMDRR